jgi:hypothetical protein
LFWYLGPVTPVLALLVAAEAARRGMLWWRAAGAAGEGHEPGLAASAVPAWFALLFVAGASSLAVLWRPGITPDHPWADRRLVPVVLPFVVICATAAVAWATRGARRRLPVTVLVAVAAAGVLALLVPAAAATWPVATDRNERGELAAVRQVCDALEPDDVVIMVDRQAAAEWTQVVRGVCGVPAAVLRLTEAERYAPRLPTVTAAVTPVARRVAAAGRRPVLMTSEDDLPLLALGLEPRRVVSLVTDEDQKLLTERPEGSLPLRMNVWMAPWEATKASPTR